MKHERWRLWRLWTEQVPAGYAVPVFSRQIGGAESYDCTRGFSRVCLGGRPYGLRYWPEEDRLELVKKPRSDTRRAWIAGEAETIATRAMPETKEELIGWCRMILELTDG